MHIKVDEETMRGLTAATAGGAAEKYKPGADILILNGYPVVGEAQLNAGDELFMARRGELPDRDELEMLMAARHTPGVHEKLKKGTVGIAGVGGLGSMVAVALARVGVGRLVIADFDVVEPTNLNRQQYFIDQIGMPKVAALRDNLARINPYINVDARNVMLGPENAATVFDGCEVVVEAFDRAEMKAMLVETVLEQMPGTFLVAASGMAGYGENNSIVTREISKRFYLVGDGVSEAAPGHGLMAPRVAIAAGHQANQAVRLLLGEGLK